MGTVLLKSSAFIFIIFAGYFLKRVGFFQADDYQLIKKIAMNITLPAAVITGFTHFEKNNTLFWLAVIGLCCNVLMIGVGYGLSRGKSGQERAFRMLNYSGYNIGSFALPFAQNFFSPFGVLVTCMFDIGNSFMCTGMSYAMTSGVTGEGGLRGLKLKNVGKRLLSSTPFLTYMTMLLLAILGLAVPTAILMLLAPVSAANAFLAMLLIGMMFRIDFKLAYLQKVAVTLLVRYGSAAVFSCLLYHYLPFALEIRQILSIIIFAPISSVTPIFTENSGGDAGLSSFVSSLTSMISLVIMTVMVISMGIY